MRYSRKLSGVSSKKTVLMLDNEPLMIDRRIILEAKSLVNAGYRVILATKGDGIKPDSSMEHGVEIERFPRMQGDQEIEITLKRLIQDRQQILDWNIAPGNLHLEKKVRNLLFFLPRFLQSLVYAIFSPPVFASSLRSRIPFLKTFLKRAFEPFCYLLLLRPSYLLPYFRIAKSRLQTQASADEFQSEIMTFSTKIKPDFVHAHDLPNLGLGISIAKKLLIPLVYDAHELYPLQFFSNKSQQTELANLERRLIGNTDAVIAVNRQCQEILQKTYSNLRDTVILSNATETPIDFDPEKRTRLWHERFNLDNSVKLMVFQGGINPARHIDHLLRAMTMLPDNIHVGFITFKKDISYYQSLTASLNIHHRVHYVLEIPWDEVILWLAAADVGVMPYQATNINAKISSPNKLFEFMVAGLPIIASSELENVRQVIEESKVGVCRLLGEDDSYVEAILDMFDDTLGGPDRFRNNVLAVRHQFTWDNEAPKLLALYERLSKKCKKCDHQRKESQVQTCAV